MQPINGDPKSDMATTHDSENGRKSVDTGLTLDQLRASNHPALERIAKRAAENMRSSAYTSHNSHHSAHN
jgi:hypothetical protein